MNVYRVKTGSILPLGKQGENLARKIQFDISRWISTLGPGTVQLLHQRRGDEAPYPVAVEREGNFAVWAVTNADTAAPGTGHTELQYYVGDALAKSETWMTKVFPALGPAGETPPETQQGWVDQVVQVGAEAKAAAERAESAAVRQPIVGDNGNWWTWDLEAGAYEDTGIYSGGDAPYIGANGNWYVGQTDTGVAATGPAGPAGTDGFSPKVTVIDFGDGEFSISIEDSAGIHSASWRNGIDGASGKDGAAGADGVGIKSVVQTTTSTEDGGANVVTVTKTDGSSSTFTVKNGNKGSDGAPGADGHTPVKGTDYFTDADKQEIVDDVLAALPTWEGGSY